MQNIEQSINQTVAHEVMCWSLVCDCEEHKATLVLMLSADNPNRFRVHIHLLQADKEAICLALLHEPVQVRLQHSRQLSAVFASS